jgi:hypothetical protein
VFKLIRAEQLTEGAVLALPFDKTATVLTVRPFGPRSTYVHFRTEWGWRRVERDRQVEVVIPDELPDYGEEVADVDLRRSIASHLASIERMWVDSDLEDVAILGKLRQADDLVGWVADRLAADNDYEAEQAEWDKRHDLTFTYRPSGVSSLTEQPPSCPRCAANLEFQAQLGAPGVGNSWACPAGHAFIQVGETWHDPNAYQHTEPPWISQGEP